MRNILVALICIFTSKVIFLHGTMAETLGVFAFIAFASVLEHYKSVSQVDQYKLAVEQQTKHVLELTKSLEDMRSSITALRMASGFKQVNGK